MCVPPHLNLWVNQAAAGFQNDDISRFRAFQLATSIRMFESQFRRVGESFNHFTRNPNSTNKSGADRRLGQKKVSGTFVCGPTPFVALGRARGRWGGRDGGRVHEGESNACPHRHSLQE